MRANIVGPLESDELATVRSRIGSSNGQDQLIQEAGNKQHRGRAPSSRCHAAAFFLGQRVRDGRHAAPAPPQSSHIEQIIGVRDSALSRPIGDEFGQLFDPL